MIFTRAFWAAAGARAAHTALAAALPLVTVVLAGERPPGYALSVVALAGLASVVTSLVSLPEVNDHTVRFWTAVASRTARTAAQVAAPALAVALTLADVDARSLAAQVVGAVVVTLLRTVMVRLPEVETTTTDGSRSWQ